MQLKKILFAVFTVSLLSCGPATKLVSTWRDPGSSINTENPNKTLIIALVKGETARHVIEDQLAKRLNGKGFASYKYVSNDLLKDENEAQFTAKLKQDGFSYVLIMRLADVEKETSYVPGNTMGYYGSYRGYYRYSAPMYYDPGYYRTDKNYFIETMVYTADPGKLIWSGVTKTVNPASLDRAVEEIGDVVTAKMRQDGFLK